MVRVFVATHQDVDAPDLRHLSLVKAGAVGSSPADHLLRDDRGDNISARNRHFCELTVLYWMWKNVSDDIVGLCHYRRLFSPVLLPEPHRCGATMDQAMALDLLRADPEGAVYRSELGVSAMIIPARTPHSHAPAMMYAASHRASDWQAMMEGLAELYPDEHAPAVAYFDTRRDMHLFNMFIAHKHVVDAYCAWLFPILFNVEGRIVPSEDPYQRRVYGFLAERLFNWWTSSRGVQLTERPLLFVQ